MGADAVVDAWGEWDTWQHPGTLEPDGLKLVRIQIQQIQD
jgi:hypothetical protein